MHDMGALPASTTFCFIKRVIFFCDSLLRKAVWYHRIVPSLDGGRDPSSLKSPGSLLSHKHRTAYLFSPQHHLDPALTPASLSQSLES